MITSVVFAIAILFFTATNSNAASLGGQITELWMNDNDNTNIAFISVGQEYATACGTAQSRYLVIDLSVPGMKEAYAMALAAFMAGKSVVMGSIGQCHGTHEKLKYIYLSR